MLNLPQSCLLLILITACLAPGSVQKLKDVNGGKPVRFMALTIVTHGNEGLERLLRSSRAYGVEMNVIRADNSGTIYSLLCVIFLRLKEIMEEYKNENDLIVLVVDGFDVVFNAGKEEIISKFKEFDANIVFGAEINCCPNIGMQYIFSKKEEGYKCLNSGMIIGYAPHLHALLQYKIRKGSQFRDQVHLSRLFMVPEIQEALKIKLDHKANLVQNLNAVTHNDYEIVRKENDTQFVNVRYGTMPALIHGNGYTGKSILNMVGNYMGRAWTNSQGCPHCEEGRIDLSKKMESDYPLVLLGIFVEDKTPFLAEMLQKVSALLYPKKNIFIYLYSNVTKQEKHILRWISFHKHEYLSTNFTLSGENLSIRDAKHLALDRCIAMSCDLFFNVDSVVHLDNPNTLQLLVSYNRTILAPVMSRINSYLTTFWGARQYWTYERSFDYLDIVNRKYVGIWNVPYISGAYVMWRFVFENDAHVAYHKIYHRCPDVDEIIFPYNIAELQMYLYATNYEDYGHLVDTDNVDANERESDLWQLEANRADWEDKYLHPNYSQVLKDANRFLLFSDHFCEDLMTSILQSNKFQSLLNFRSTAKLDILFNELEEIDYREEWLDIYQNYVLPFSKSIIKEDQRTNPVIRIAVEDNDTNKAFDGGRIASQPISSTPINVACPASSTENPKQEIPISKCTLHDHFVVFISLVS